jgi:hypothetical protein
MMDVVKTLEKLLLSAFWNAQQILNWFLDHEATRMENASCMFWGGKSQGAPEDAESEP